MPNIDLYIPDSKAFQILRERLEYHNNKDTLQEVAEVFLKAFGQSPIVFWNNEQLAATPTYVSCLLSSRNQIKLVYTQFCAMMLCEKRNMQAFFSLLPEKQTKALRDLLLYHYIPMADLETKYDIPLINNSSNNSYGWRNKAKLDLPFVEYLFSGYDNKWNYTYKIRIQEGFREFIYEPLLPGMSQLEIYDELPKSINTHDYELSTLQIVPVVEALLEREILEFNGARFTTASIKKAAKQLGAEEFFSNNTLPKEMTLIRNSFLLQAAGFVDKMTKKVKRHDSAEEAIKHYVRKMMPLTNQTYPMVMNYISGLRPNHYYNCYGTSLIERTISNLMDLPTGKWISVDSFIRHSFDSKPYHNQLTFFYRSNSAAKINNKFARIEHEIDYFNQINELGKPYVKGLLFLLASWGILEAGCRDYSKDDVSPYDSLLNIRLTRLGEYVYDLSPTYEAPITNNEEALFELDPARLIIRSLTENNPYESLLTDTCTSIGNHRYKMNAETFLARCCRRKDVEDKIAFFKRYISGELSPLWEEFFDSLLKRCKPLTPLDLSKYHLYSISPDNKELVKLLSSDPILQELFIRAENYIILVPNANHTKFENRLKSLGYLI